MPRIKLSRDWLIVFGILTVVYLLFNIVLKHITSVSTYIIQPIIWGLVVYYIRRLPGQRSVAKLSVRGTLFKLAFGIGFFQIYLAVIAGFFEKFGRSPNSFTPKGIIVNLIFVSTTLLGTEVCRAWLSNRLARKPYAFVPVFITLFFTFFCLPLHQIVIRGSMEEVVQFWGSTFLPLLVENLLASFLAMWGGVRPALAYRGVLQAFEWFCPILPDLNWAMKALVGTLVPVIGLVIVEQYAQARYNPGKFRRDTGKGMMGWVILSVVSVVLIWFSLGVFPVRPTVIISGSMRPAIEVGDMPIVARVNLKLLKNGDIIQFRQEGNPIPTVHRIIDTRMEGEKKFYVTKGDNNNIQDPDPVYPEQVVGKVVFIVPKAGWATIAVKQLLNKS